MPYILNGEVFYNWLSVVWCRTFWTVKCSTTGWVLCDAVHSERWSVLQLAECCAMSYILNGEVFYNWLSVVWCRTFWTVKWLSVVRCRTFWTVKCTTTAASTQLKATTWDVTMATDSHSGSSASNHTVCMLWNFRFPEFMTKHWNV